MFVGSVLGMARVMGLAALLCGWMAWTTAADGAEAGGPAAGLTPPIYTRQALFAIPFQMNQGFPRGPECRRSRAIRVH